MPKAEGVRKRTHTQPKAQRRNMENTVAKRNISDSIGVGWLLFRAAFYSTLILTAYLLFAYATSPTSSITVEDFHDVTKLEWAKLHNTDLQNGRTLVPDLAGPQSIVVDNAGIWYASLTNGRIVKVTNGFWPNRTTEDVTRKVDSSADSEIRQPLDLRLVNNRLYLVDSYQGIFVLDILDNNPWRKVVGNGDISPPVKFANDLVVSKDEKTIYFVDSSKRWQYHEVGYILAEGECSGRVLKVDVQSKKVEQIRDELCSPNGIELNPEETKLLVSEHCRARVSIIDLGSGDILKTVHLPGGADNIRRAKSGGYWIPIPSLHNPKIELTLGYPFIRDIAAKILGAEGIVGMLNVQQGIVVRLDAEFDPVSIHYDLDGKVCRAITEVQEYVKGKFLLGSFITQGIVYIENLGG